MKAGRPIGSNSGRKIGLALKEANVISEHTKSLEFLLSKMSDRQKRLFSSLAKGRNELEAVVESELYEYITGVAKIVYSKDGRPFKTTSLRTIKDLGRLSSNSYDRLLRLAISAVKNNVGDIETLKSLDNDLNWFLKLIAPEAARSIIGIMFDKKCTQGLRLKAAIEILNRAGYSGSADNPEERSPIRVSIVDTDLTVSSGNPN